MDVKSFFKKSRIPSKKFELITHDANSKCQTTIEEVEPMPGKCFYCKPHPPFATKESVKASIKPEECKARQDRDNQKHGPPERANQSYDKSKNEHDAYPISSIHIKVIHKFRILKEQFRPREGALGKIGFEN